MIKPSRLRNKGSSNGNRRKPNKNRTAKGRKNAVTCGPLGNGRCGAYLDLPGEVLQSSKPWAVMLHVQNFEAATRKLKRTLYTILKASFLNYRSCKLPLHLKFWFQGRRQYSRSLI